MVLLLLVSRTAVPDSPQQGAQSTPRGPTRSVQWLHLYPAPAHLLFIGPAHRLRQLPELHRGPVTHSVLLLRNLRHAASQDPHLPRLRAGQNQNQNLQSQHAAVVALFPRQTFACLQPLDLCSPDRTLLMAEEMILHLDQNPPAKVGARPDQNHHCVD